MGRLRNTGRTVDQCIYLERGKSGAAGKRRPLFERMRKDAALRKFDRILVWKVTRLGRDMRNGSPGIHLDEKRLSRPFDMFPADLGAQV